MAADHGRTGPQARHRRGARPLVVAIAAVMVAAACAPRTAPLASAAAPGGVRGSAGCDRAAAALMPERVLVGGAERTFLVRLPSGSPTTPRDLVIAFHGRTNDAAQVRRYFGLDAALPEAIVVYPRALAAGPGTFAWAAPGDPPDGQRDFALVEALIASIGAARCIDLDRVFVVGHSLGAYFANDVACRMGERIRAVASVAGGLQSASCVGGTAALLVHHPDDRLVRVGEGERARDTFRSANALRAAPPSAVVEGPLARLRCARHGDADTADPVVWCPRDDATTPRGRDPHTWPAGTAVAIAAFFAGLR